MEQCAKTQNSVVYYPDADVLFQTPKSFIHLVASDHDGISNSPSPEEGFEKCAGRNRIGTTRDTGIEYTCLVRGELIAERLFAY